MSMTPHPQRCETCKNVTDSTVRIGYKKCKLSGMLLNSNFDMFEHSSITGCASHSSRPHTCNIMTCEKAIDACLDSHPHTPVAPLKNLEAYTKGRSDVLDEILSKTIGDQHTYLMTQHDTTIRNQTLDEVLPGIQEDINDLTKEVCVGFHTMQGVQDELQKISYKIESLRSTQSTGGEPR